MVRAVDKADAMLTLSRAIYNIGSHLPFTSCSRNSVWGWRRVQVKAAKPVFCFRDIQSWWAF